jgi:hypothetical protein
VQDDPLAFGPAAGGGSGAGGARESAAADVRMAAAVVIAQAGIAQVDEAGTLVLAPGAAELVAKALDDAGHERGTVARTQTAAGAGPGPQLDIDLVQIDAAPIGSALDTIRGTLMALTLALVPRGYDKEGVGIEPTEKSHGA